MVPAPPMSMREFILQYAWTGHAPENKRCCRNEVICLESKAPRSLKRREPSALSISALWHTWSLSRPVSIATEASPEMTWQLENSFSWGPGKSFGGLSFEAACSWWKARLLPAQECSTALKWALLVNALCCVDHSMCLGVRIHLCSHRLRNMILKFKQYLAFWVAFRIILHLDIQCWGDGLCGIVFACICLHQIWDKTEYGSTYSASWLWVWEREN